MKENRWSTTQFDRPPMTKPRTPEEIALNLAMRLLGYGSADEPWPDELQEAVDAVLAALREAAEAAVRQEREALRAESSRYQPGLRTLIHAWLDARSRPEEPKV